MEPDAPLPVVARTLSHKEIFQITYKCTVGADKHFAQNANLLRNLLVASVHLLNSCLDFFQRLVNHTVHAHTAGMTILHATAPGLDTEAAAARLHVHLIG